MVAISVKGNVLERLWRSRGFDAESLSKACEIEVERLREIAGSGKASLGELERIADATRVTLTEILAGQFLPHREVVDYRTRRSLKPKPSALLFEALEIVQNRIEALRDEDIAPSVSADVCNIFNEHKTSRKCAAAFRKLIGIDVESPSYKRDKLLYWKTRIEKLGVIISYFDLGAAAEGFAISEDSVAAIVVSSSSKSKESKLFGILHEFAHIIRRESAISDHSWKQSTEAWCNKFAAHCLMPARDFARFYRSADLEQILDQDVMAGLSMISKRYGASMQAAAYHLDNLGLGSGDYGSQYHSLVKSGFEYSELESMVEMESGNKNTHFYKKINDLGVAYINSVGAAVRSNRIDKYQASDLLGTKYKYIEPLIGHAEKRLIAYSD